VNEILMLVKRLLLERQRDKLVQFKIVLLQFEKSAFQLLQGLLEGANFLKSQVLPKNRLLLLLILFH
jgi:hypothetical protein